MGVNDSEVVRYDFGIDSGGIEVSICGRLLEGGLK
jgi:hypothetical protein